MSKILFFSQPTIGHTNAMLTIAAQLKENGHDVSFGVPTIMNIKDETYGRLPEIVKTALSIPQKIKAQGIECLKIEVPLKIIVKSGILPLTKGFIETEYAKDVFSDCILEYARIIEKIVIEKIPDVIVSDFSFLAPYIVSEKYDIPCVTVYHSGLPFKGKGIPPFGSGLPIGGDWGMKGKFYEAISSMGGRLIKNRYKKACHVIGNKECTEIDLSIPYSKWLNLILTIEQIEAPRILNNDNTVFVGPCFSAKRIDTHEEFPFDLIDNKIKKIYVSLGTVFNDKPEVFRKIILGLENEEFQVIVSAGGAFDKLQQFQFKSNVLIFKRVPQLEILKKVDLVISHGGNNTINETLAAGKPIIVMPVGGEQGDNASKIEYLNVGKRVKISKFTSNEIGEKVKDIFANGKFAINAYNVGKILNNYDGVKQSAQLIECIAIHKIPISNFKVSGSMRMN